MNTGMIGLAAMSPVDDLDRLHGAVVDLHVQ